MVRFLKTVFDLADQCVQQRTAFGDGGVLDGEVIRALDDHQGALQIVRPVIETGLLDPARRLVAPDGDDDIGTAFRRHEHSVVTQGHILGQPDIVLDRDMPDRFGVEDPADQQRRLDQVGRQPLHRPVVSDQFGGEMSTRAVA